MVNSIFIVIGVIIIIFIISVSLMIFAPKSINFYDSDIFPIVKYINNNNNQLIKDGFYKIKNDEDWLEFPDKDNINGKCEIWPIYMFNIKLDKRIEKILDLYNLIKNIPDVKTIAFVKIEPNSSINKIRQWKLLSDTLRCIFVIDSPDDTVDKCAIWINGESKKIKSNDLLICDSSKEHAIYNKTKYPLYLFILDISRPENIPNGISDREYNDEINNFIYKLSQE